MVHLWRSRGKEETETSKSAPGVGAIGDIAVVVEGKKLDIELVRLACLMAKKLNAKFTSSTSSKFHAHYLSKPSSRKNLRMLINYLPRHCP